MTGQEIKSLSSIIDHYISDERTDYFDYLDNHEADNNHIYNDLLTLQKFLENDKQPNQCAHCGESDFEIEKDSPYIWVICLSCQNTGPMRFNKEAAMQAWNDGV